MGRKRTTGKYQTVQELEDAVQFFSETQGEFQAARTCGVSPSTVRNILERTKEKTMSGHTQGPWATFDEHPEQVTYHIRRESDPSPIATIFRYEGNPHDTLADACLIAAAPEMLEALEFFVAAGGDAIYCVEGEELQDCVDKARAAIAKAKGAE